MEVSCISGTEEKKKKKNLMTAVPIFVLSFKFIAGFVEHRNN